VNEKHLNYFGNEINYSNTTKNKWIDLVGDGINQPGVDRYYYENSPFSGKGYSTDGDGYHGTEINYYYRKGYLIFIEQKNLDQNVVLAETQLNVYGTKVKEGYLSSSGAWLGDFIGIKKIFEGY